MCEYWYKAFWLILHVCVAGACVKVIQLLQHFEQLSSVCAQAVAAWSSEYGIKAIVGEIMRYFSVQNASYDLNYIATQS